MICLWQSAYYLSALQEQAHTSAHHTFVLEKHIMKSSPLHLTQPELPVHGPIKVQNQSTDRSEPDAPRWSLLGLRLQNFQQSSFKAKARWLQGLHSDRSSANIKKPKLLWRVLLGISTGKVCIRACISQTGGGLTLTLDRCLHFSNHTHNGEQVSTSKCEAWSWERISSENRSMACELIVIYEYVKRFPLIKACVFL